MTVVTQVAAAVLDQEEGTGRGLGQGGGVERRMRLLSGGHDLEERGERGEKVTEALKISFSDIQYILTSMFNVRM